MPPKKSQSSRRADPVSTGPDGLPAGIGSRIKGWLTLDGEFFMGPRYVKLLEGIDRSGTIRDGCKATGMSYRTCLNRIRQMERALGMPLVLTSRGGQIRGRAELTPAARRLVSLYRDWRDVLEQSSKQAFRAGQNGA